MPGASRERACEARARAPHPDAGLARYRPSLAAPRSRRLMSAPFVSRTVIGIKSGEEEVKGIRNSPLSQRGVGGGVNVLLPVCEERRFLFSVVPEAERVAFYPIVVPEAERITLHLRVVPEAERSEAVRDP